MLHHDLDGPVARHALNQFQWNAGRQGQDRFHAPADAVGVATIHLGGVVKAVGRIPGVDPGAFEFIPKQGKDRDVDLLPRLRCLDRDIRAGKRAEGAKVARE